MIKKRLGTVPAYLALTLVGLLFLFPFYWVIISSLKSVDGINLRPRRSIRLRQRRSRSKLNPIRFSCLEMTICSGLRRALTN